MPSYRVTNKGVPYKKPSLMKFYFYLPELETWLGGNGQADKVVVPFKDEPSPHSNVDYRDYVHTRTFFQESDGTSRMDTFIEDIIRDQGNERHGQWLDRWKELLRTVATRISQLWLTINTIKCERRYAIESYLSINSTARIMTPDEERQAEEDAKKDRTKIFDELLSHPTWKGVVKESDARLRLSKSRAFQRKLFEQAAVLLFECGLKSDGDWWEWGRLTRLDQGAMQKESNVNHDDEKYADFVAKNREAVVKRLVQAHQKSSSVAIRFPSQFLPPKLLEQTFLAFVLADSTSVPSDDKMLKLIVRMLCNTVAGGQCLDNIRGPVQLYKGAVDPLATGGFDYKGKLPEWHVKFALNSEPANAWVSGCVYPFVCNRTLNSQLHTRTITQYARTHAHTQARKHAHTGDRH